MYTGLLFETTIKPSHKSQKMPEVLLLYLERSIQFALMKMPNTEEINLETKKSLRKDDFNNGKNKKEGNIRASEKRREKINK